MHILEYTVEELNDPTGILEGKRFEFFLYLQLEEEDELYDAAGTGLRVLYLEQEQRIAAYHFFHRSTNQVLDFELEEEERAEVLQFCQDHV